MDGYTYCMVNKYLKSNILNEVTENDHIFFIESTSEKFEDIFEAF
jgi:hypothetical protein